MIQTIHIGYKRLKCFREYFFKSEMESHTKNDMAERNNNPRLPGQRMKR